MNLDEKLKKIGDTSNELESLLLSLRHGRNGPQIAEAYKKLCEFNDWLLRAMRVPMPVEADVTEEKVSLET